MEISWMKLMTERIENISEMKMGKTNVQSNHVPTITCHGVLKTAQCIDMMVGCWGSKSVMRTTHLQAGDQMGSLPDMAPWLWDSNNCAIMHTAHVNISKLLRYVAET